MLPKLPKLLVTQTSYHILHATQCKKVTQITKVTTTLFPVVQGQRFLDEVTQVTKITSYQRIFFQKHHGTYRTTTACGA